MKLVINKCYGGFGISLAATKHMAAAGSVRAQKVLAEYAATLARFEQYKRDGVIKGVESDRDRKFETGMFDIDIKYGKEPRCPSHGYVEDMDGDYERNDPLLVAAVEALGDAADGEHAALKVVEIPDGVEYEIGEYDGIEHIAETHRTWG